MINSDKLTTSATSTERKTYSVEEVAALQQDLRLKRANTLLNLFLGVRVIEDPTGMWCGKNEYCIVAGPELYKQLAEASK